MSRYTRQPADMGSALDVAARLRWADIREIQAASGMTPVAAMQYAVTCSRLCHLMLVDGKPVGAMGATDFTPNERVGVPWMLVTSEAERHPKGLTRANMDYVDELMGHYRCLINFVDNRNKKAQTWLRWLGFTLDPPQPFGVSQLPFRRFWKGDLGELCVSRQDTVNQEQALPA